MYITQLFIPLQFSIPLYKYYDIPYIISRRLSQLYIETDNEEIRKISFLARC